MASKDRILFLKESSLNGKRHSDKESQYSNLNLNQQNQKYSNELSFHSCSKSKHNKQFEQQQQKILKADTDYGNYAEKSSGKPWINSKIDTGLNSIINANSFDKNKEESKKKWKKDGTSNIAIASIGNSSTLSLHISAYEKLNKSDENATAVETKTSDTLKIQLPEFSRQMDQNVFYSPEIMQFKASQKLFKIFENQHVRNYQFRNSWFYSASTIGVCIGAVLFLRKTLKPVPYSWIQAFWSHAAAQNIPAFPLSNFVTREAVPNHFNGHFSSMSSGRLIPQIFRGLVFLPQRSSSTITSTFQPFRSFASYAPKSSRKHSKSKKPSSSSSTRPPPAARSILPPPFPSTIYDENQIIPDALADLPQPERIYRRPQYYFNPEHDKDGGSEYPAIILTKDEKDIGIPFLKKVVSTLEERGQQFVLPWGDDTAIESILGILRELTTTTGVLPEFLFDAFTQKPDLFAAITRDGNKCIEIFDCLCDMCGFSIQDTIRMFGSYTNELLETDSNEISQRLSNFLGVGVRAGRPLGRIVRRCPAILFASDPQQMAENVEALGSFFSRSILPKILANDPEIVLKNFELIESIYEYIYYHMRCEPAEFIETRQWSQHSLDEVMNRHQFLLKTGKYELPDPKKPQLKMENPPLHRIFDTNDETFATKVANVTLEEWMVYKELAEKLEALEDKERPFERIKPSQRKAFERRLKETKEKEDYVFEA